MARKRRSSHAGERRAERRALRRRRRLWLGALLVGGVGALAASWFGWGRDGLTPVDPASPEAESVMELYLFLGVVAVAVFLAVMLPLAVILWRDGADGASKREEGAQVHGHVRLELLWTAIPLVIVLVISGYTWRKAGEINDQASRAKNADLLITVEGRQFYWRYRYANGAVAIDRLRVPVDRLVQLDVTAPDWDVVHSFWSPALNGKVDAIPGQTNHLRFRPQEVGVFDGRCGELCGLQHAAMELSVEVLPQQEFARWLRDHRPSSSDASQLGGELWGGVCAKCHGAAPEFAPSLEGSALLRDEQALRRVVTEGIGRMPPVGRGWSDAELDALVQFARRIGGGDSGQ
jgi:cytochrome c oxidase subunit II